MIRSFRQVSVRSHVAFASGSSIGIVPGLQASSRPRWRFGGGYEWLLWGPLFPFLLVLDELDMPHTNSLE